MAFCFSLPLYGFGSLSDDNSGVSFAVCTFAGEEDGMVRVGSLLCDVSRARRSFWKAHGQTLVQSKKEQQQAQMIISQVLGI